ncbi:hypothetical protein [Variovorax saccharolyticus]|nr:hypothetical protein [Variovorax sp. J31P216]
MAKLAGERMVSPLAAPGDFDGTGFAWLWPPVPERERRHPWTPDVLGMS